MSFAIATKPTYDPWPYIIGGSVFILALVVIGSIVVPWVRRRYLSPESDSKPGSAFDIASLERSKREGLITDEEFRRLRRIALGLDIKPAKAENSASSAPVARDDEGTDAPSGSGQDAEADDENEEKPQEE